MLDCISMNISRRDFLAKAGAGTIAATACTLPVSGDTRPPNLVYLFSDEHRWHSMSFTEMASLQTPNMARLAAEGMQSTNCISNYPVCSPYRAVLLTGRWPHETGVIDNDLPLSPNEFTVGTAFKHAGYRTGYIGKWHLRGTRAEPFGFEHSLIWDKTNTHWDTSTFYPAQGEPVTPKGYNATLMTDQALAFMETNKQHPFCLFVSWNPPHASFTDAPESKKALYPQGALPYRPNWFENDTRDADPDQKFLRSNGWPEYEGYHAHISAIDDELGRVLAKLKELNLENDTIVIYTSDHGSQFGSHGVGSKRQPYEESIRVPFLIRWPGRIKADTKCDALFGAIDIMPTLCGLAGLKPPATCRGKDFSGHFLGNGGPNPESQFIMHIQKENASGKKSHPAPIFRGVRTERYTYFVTDSGDEVLFDNGNDPYQLKNIVTEKHAQATRKKCAAMTRAWLREANDPFGLGGLRA